MQQTFRLILTCLIIWVLIFATDSAHLPGEWANLASGLDGSFTNDVLAIAVSGTDVYMYGIFQNVVNLGVALTAADHIVKWNSHYGLVALPTTTQSSTKTVTITSTPTQTIQAFSKVTLTPTEMGTAIPIESPSPSPTATVIQPLLAHKTFYRGISSPNKGE